MLERSQVFLLGFSIKNLAKQECALGDYELCLVEVIELFLK